MVITKYTPAHAKRQSAQPLTCLYNCRVRSTNPPYLKKQTQFPKNSNPPKIRYNNNLRPIGHVVTQDKANPNKPDLGPNTPPARAQNIPNLLPHNKLRTPLQNQKQTQTNPISPLPPGYSRPNTPNLLLPTPTCRKNNCTRLQNVPPTLQRHARHSLD